MKNTQKGRPKNYILKEHIKELHEKGLTIKEISELTGRQPRVIYYHIKDLSTVGSLTKNMQ